MPLVCHVVDRMGDRRDRFKCPTAVRLCAVCLRAVHVRHPFAVSAHVFLGSSLFEKLRHLASVRLTCMHITSGRCPIYRPPEGMNGLIELT